MAEIGEIQQILLAVQQGRLPLDDAERQLKALGFADLGVAKLDTGRQARRGFAETIFCLRKTPEQVRQIFEGLMQRADVVFATKAGQEHWDALRHISSAVYDPVAQTVTCFNRRVEPVPGVIVTSAGTSDLPVALEAARTLEAMGCDAHCIFDVGVAGLHRLMAHLDAIRAARVIVAVAGMDGALPAVISGLVCCPVIAVPTSVGYGANFGGISALLTMLNSCSPGISVVNIDNGFGAGYLAAVINRLESLRPGPGHEAQTSRE